MATVELTEKNFEETIKNNDMVLVDFWAGWCGPCRSFGPIYENASEKHLDAVFGKINTEEERNLAGTFQIRSIPTLVIFREQIIIYKNPGSLPAHALEELLEKAKALDMDIVRQEMAQQQNNKADA
ncbi:MAG: thioredoxin [Gammaproteobacteria bacterium]|nr:thioredoxin [Gammaproteobacteria bacterium]